MANLSPTLGHEQSGIRPVLVISNDYLNRSKADLCIILPITSKIKGINTHIPITPPDGGLSKNSVIICEAIRCIAKERFINKLGSISENTIKTVENILSLLLGLKS